MSAVQYRNLGRIQEECTLDVKLNNCGFYKSVDRVLHTRRVETLRKDHHIVLVQHGRFQVWVNGAFQTASDGDLVYFPPEYPQDYLYHPGENTVYYWIHFEGKQADMILSLMNLAAGIHHMESLTELLGFLDQILTCPIHIHSAYYFVLNTYLQSFLSTLYRTVTAPYETNQTNRLLRGIIHAIQTHPEQALSVQEYAAKCGISDYHFTKLFREYTGTTPLQFRNHALAEKARQLLLDTDMNISEISQTVGIEDVLYFSRLFKKYYGISPRGYRNTHRN